MLKCNQPYIIPLIIAVVLIIIIYYGYKYKKIFFVLLMGGIGVWYVMRKNKIDLSPIQPNNIHHKDVFDLPLYFIEYK